MRLGLSVISACLCACGTIALAASGPFDGYWAIQRGTCFPSRVVTPGGKWVVKNNSFTLAWSADRVPYKCTAEIAADGSFDNQACELPMTGKFAGDQLNLKFQTKQSHCEVAATRAK